MDRSFVSKEGWEYYPDLYIDVRGVRTRYWDIGKEKKTVVLIHGMGGSAEVWAWNIPFLLKHYRVVTLDLVGFGLSDKPDGAYDFAFFTEFLEGFFDAMNLPSSVVIGHSLGAAVALQFAASFTSRVERLVLVSLPMFCSHFPLYFRLPTVRFLGEFLVRPPADLETVRRGFHALTCTRLEWAEETVRRYYEMGHLPNAGRATLRHLRNYFTIFGVNKRVVRSIQPEISKKLCAMRQRTLIIHGRQDALIEFESTEIALRNIPNSRLIAFDQCGHGPPFELPNEFNGKVLQFLQEE